MMILILLLILPYVDSRKDQRLGLIVEGEMTTAQVYPHQVYLEIHSIENWICGGSFLNQILILTAAHCLEDLDPSGSRGAVAVKYGAEDLAHSKIRRMKAFRMHPQYDMKSMYGDVALVICRRAVLFGETVARVAVMRNPPIENIGYVAGWGAINEALDTTTILKHVKVKIDEEDRCYNWMHLPEGSFCAGNGEASERGITDGFPSLGDSGGGLVIKSFIQIGIVSYRIKGRHHVAYTNVSYFLPWIRRNANDLYCTHVVIE